MRSRQNSLAASPWRACSSLTIELTGLVCVRRGKGIKSAIRKVCDGHGLRAVNAGFGEGRTQITVKVEGLRELDRALAQFTKSTARGGAQPRSEKGRRSYCRRRAAKRATWALISPHVPISSLHFAENNRGVVRHVGWHLNRFGPLVAFKRRFYMAGTASLPRFAHQTDSQRTGPSVTVADAGRAGGQSRSASAGRLEVRQSRRWPRNWQASIARRI